MKSKGFHENKFLSLLPLESGSNVHENVNKLENKTFDNEKFSSLGHLLNNEQDDLRVTECIHRKDPTESKPETYKRNHITSEIKTSTMNNTTLLKRKGDVSKGERKTKNNNGKDHAVFRNIFLDDNESEALQIYKEILDIVKSNQDKNINEGTYHTNRKRFKVIIQTSSKLDLYFRSPKRMHSRRIERYYRMPQDHPSQLNPWHTNVHRR